MFNGPYPLGIDPVKPVHSWRQQKTAYNSFLWLEPNYLWLVNFSDAAGSLLYFWTVSQVNARTNTGPCAFRFSYFSVIFVLAQSMIHEKHTYSQVLLPTRVCWWMVFNLKVDACARQLVINPSKSRQHRAQTKNHWSHCHLTGTFKLGLRMVNRQEEKWHLAGPQKDKTFSAVIERKKILYQINAIAVSLPCLYT